eukprot:jgi/Mesvir1/24505/Mv21853-RA.2
MRARQLASLSPGVRMFLVASLLTVATSSQGLLTTASQSSGGSYAYNFATVPFLAECIKFCMSVLLLHRQRSRDPLGTHVTTDWRSIRLFPIPSVIYLVHNNIQFLTLRYVDPSTYQILGNLKIVTTGILFRTFLKRKLNKLQWIALFLLLIGATTSQISGCLAPTGSILNAPVQGYLFGICSAWLSALAGVYTEYLMKKNEDSLYWQNMQLYGFGILFNAMRLTYDDIKVGFENGLWTHTLLRGYDGWTWAVVLNLAFTGLIVSWVMKFADNIIKVYATSMAMLLTLLISAVFFDLSPSLQLFLGILIAFFSLQLYFMPVKDLLADELSLKDLGLPPSSSKGIDSAEEVPLARGSGSLLLRRDSSDDARAVGGISPLEHRAVVINHDGTHIGASNTAMGRKQMSVPSIGK